VTSAPISSPAEPVPPAREPEPVRKTATQGTEADRPASKAAKPPAPLPQTEPPPVTTAVETDPEPAAPEEENAVGPAVEAWKQGNGLESQGDHAGAIAAYSKALSIKPRYAAAYTNRGLSRFRSDDFANAVADYSRAIDILPKAARTYLLRGNARVQLKQLDPAMSDFSRAIELNPQLGPAWGARGALYATESQFRKALSDLDQAVRLAPRQEIWYRNRATARRMLGDTAGADADQAQARKLMARKGADGRGGR
jgi:tetratricopeptide (TPR) repeat protein